LSFVGVADLFAHERRGVKSFVGIAAVAMRRRSSNDNGCRCEGSTEFRKRPSRATSVGRLENVPYLF
jgi:hypothetical protein